MLFPIILIILFVLTPLTVFAQFAEPNPECGSGYVLNEMKTDCIPEIENQKPLVTFVDPKKDPYHYIDRYYAEPDYRMWFDKNYPDLTIEEAVRLIEPLNQIEEQYIECKTNAQSKFNQAVRDYMATTSSGIGAEINLAERGITLNKYLMLCADKHLNSVNEMGINLIERNEPKHALDYFNFSLELFPDDPIVLFNKGIALLALGENTSAKISLEKALEIDPNFESAQETLSKISENEKSIQSICGKGTIEKHGQCVVDLNYVSQDTKEAMQDTMVEKLCSTWDTELENLRKYGYSKSSEVLVDMNTDEIIEYIEQQKNELGCKEERVSSIGGGCLIATATYGSELTPQVQQLRELRDSKLLQTESGTSFIESFNSFYYSFSPHIADYERENPAFKEAVKLFITPMIASLSILNHVNMDSEVEVLSYGISLIVLNVGMYVGMPVAVIIGMKKRV